MMIPPSYALNFFDKTIANDFEPAASIGTLINKEHALADLNRNEEAILCFDEVLEISQNSKYALKGREQALSKIKIKKR